MFSNLLVALFFLVICIGLPVLAVWPVIRQLLPGVRAEMEAKRSR